MLIVFIVAMVLLLGHVAFQTWLYRDAVLDTAMSVWVPTKEWGIWAYNRSYNGFFVAKDWLLVQYNLLKGQVPDMPDMSSITGGKG